MDEQMRGGKSSAIHADDAAGYVVPMIERVTKAVHEALSTADIMAYLDMPEDIASIVARAAITSMREPDETMWQAGWAIVPYDVHENALADAWHAMVDAALAEGE